MDKPIPKLCFVSERIIPRWRFVFSSIANERELNPSVELVSCDVSLSVTAKYLLDTCSWIEAGMGRY